MKESIFLLAFAALLLIGSAACDVAALAPNNAEPDIPTVSSPEDQSPTPQPAPSPTPPDKKGESTDTTALDWIDAMGMISIPTILSYEEVGLHGELLITGDILISEADIWGDTWMYVGPLMGDFEPLVDGAESFVFDDGHIGIFTKTFDLDIMAWIRMDGMLVTLRHGGDMSIFTDNEELILQIVRSLR